jgi:oligopeptide transport system ATP-binding protein
LADKNALLQVKNLVKYFPVKKQHIKAVDDVSFSVEKGTTFGLVGESGCGKSTTARTIIRLYKPDSGEIRIDGEDISGLSRKALLPYRKKMQMIFQDPYSSLNERMTVQDIICESLIVHNICAAEERKDYVISLLRKVGLSAGHANRYPHEFSGGQRQRIGIARALAVQPEIILCDEPISALDVSIQAQVINMLEDLQSEMGLTYLFIAHDLSMVRHISNTMGVMYLGRIIELVDSEELYKNPLHPYSQGLLAANPIPDPRKIKREILLKGDVPSPLDIPSGCRFRTRCNYAKPICSEVEPELKGTDHKVACHLYQ